LSHYGIPGVAKVLQLAIKQSKKSNNIMFRKLHRCTTGFNYVYLTWVFPLNTLFVSKHQILLTHNLYQHFCSPYFYLYYSKLNNPTDWVLVNWVAAFLEWSNFDLEITGHLFFVKWQLLVCITFTVQSFSFFKQYSVVNPFYVPPRPTMIDTEKFSA
jgi:hypothetical protein